MTYTQASSTYINQSLTYERKRAIVKVQLRLVHIAVLLLTIEMLVEVQVHL